MTHEALCSFVLPIQLFVTQAVPTEVPVLLLTIVPVLLNGLDQLVQLVRILPSTLLFHFVHFQSKNVHCFPFQMSMSVLLVLTTVNNCVPTLQEAITVVVTVDMSCRLMDTSVKVFVTMHSEPLLIVHKF